MVKDISISGAGNDGSKLEKLSDDLLKSCHSLGKQAGIYTEAYLINQSKYRREISITDIADLPDSPINNKCSEALFECLWQEIISGAHKCRCTERQILFMGYRKAGLTYREIAKLCNCSKSTVQDDCKKAAEQIQKIPAFGLWTVLSEVFHVSVDRIKAILVSKD